MTNTVRVLSSELEAGMVVHFYGARFELQDNRKVSEQNGMQVYGITGKWLDGAIIPNYFGPSKDWRFQGNDRASWCVEA